MRVDIDFELVNDKNDEIYNVVSEALANRYDWHRAIDCKYISGDVQDVTDNVLCASKARDMFVAVVQDVANQKHQIINIKALDFMVNCVAKSYKPGDKIEYITFKNYQDIIIEPQE